MDVESDGGTESASIGALHPAATRSLSSLAVPLALVRKESNASLLVGHARCARQISTKSGWRRASAKLAAAFSQFVNSSQPTLDKFDDDELGEPADG
jgi:hypothetical protein